MSDPSLWKEAGISPDSSTRLSAFVDLILEWNARINLTGFRTRGDVEDKLIAPAILALPVVQAAGKRVLDFGSGAGIPGLVWAICEPAARITSVEIRNKKAAFQKEAVRTTGISAEIICGHFPEAVAGRKFERIATRAVRFSQKLWDQAELLLDEKGSCVFFAAPDFSEPGWHATTLQDGSCLFQRQRRK